MYEIEEIIKSNDLEKLKSIINVKFFINMIIPVKGLDKLLPINCALIHKSFDVVRFLVEKNIQLNDKKEPTIVYAAMYGDEEILKILIEKGANINLEDKNRGSALMSALIWENFETANQLIECGIDLRKIGGECLRYAAWKGYINIVEKLVNKGVNINFNAPDMIFPNKTTPLNAAVREGHGELVKYLLENGADVTISDKWGFRAFHEAKEQNNFEIIEILKKYEEKDLHDRDWCINNLKNNNLPDEVIEFLASSNKKWELKKSKLTKSIVFCSIYEVRIFIWNKIKFIDLISYIENYENIGVFAWLPDQKVFATLDSENDKFGIIKGMTWNDFIKNPDKYIDGSLSWEFCEKVDE